MCRFNHNSGRCCAGFVREANLWLLTQLTVQGAENIGQLLLYIFCHQPGPDTAPCLTMNPCGHRR